MGNNSSEKILEWSERIKQQKLSNKSVVFWCQEQGISPNTFQIVMEFKKVDQFEKTNLESALSHGYGSVSRLD